MKTMLSYIYICIYMCVYLLISVMLMVYLQKIRRSTRRRDVPSGENCGPCVPCSADSKSNVMLYSPFNIETPASGKLSGHATTGPV